MGVHYLILLQFKNSHISAKVQANTTKFGRMMLHSTLNWHKNMTFYKSEMVHGRGLFY